MAERDMDSDAELMSDDDGQVVLFMVLHTD